MDGLFSLFPTCPTENLPKQSTSGVAGLTALSTSATASGYQQLANLSYAESTFVCPSYWLAEAYSKIGKKGFKIQYSVPIALHSYDEIALFGNMRLPIHGDDFVEALQTIVGRFVKMGTPSFSSNIVSSRSESLENWPTFTAPHYKMVNSNQTGGKKVPVNSTLDPRLHGICASWYIGPGLRNSFETVNGRGWEGGRGLRCDFWRSIAGKAPL
ncbi:hypothetical protein BKA63DRAFT_85008 [Paraphoma chrysanthemicola]|nr:hypothetical protein BKA63DRAFT_85008 [Paraphoma chrysanthemicola]